MTEQQIKHLEKILNHSKADLETPELDKKILLAAKTKTSTNSRPINFNPFNLIQFGFLGSATLSIMITAGIFFTLNRIISVERSSSILSADPITLNKQNQQRNVTQSTQTPEIISRPDHIVIAVPTTQHARDQILMEMDLPDIKTLLSKMESPLSKDIILTENLIVQAMDDIRLMISNGKLNNARQRYDELKRYCISCSLPESLEALVLNNRISLDTS